MIRKYFHLLMKAAPGARPHKYVKRTPKPGGGYQYFYEEAEAEAAKLTAKERIQRSVSQMANVELTRLKGKKTEDYKEVAAVYKKEGEYRTKKGDTKVGRIQKEVGRIIEARGQALAGGKKEGVKGQPHSVWASAAAAQLGREIGLPEGSMWVPPTARRIEKLVTSGEMTRDEALAETRSSLGLSTKKQKTQKSFTEENMNDELSLSEREGARIATEVRVDEEALVEKMVKAIASTEVEEADLEKAAQGGKYLKRIPKPGGGYRYIYHSEKHRVAHQADRMEAKAKKLKARAKSLAENDMLASAGKLSAKADMLMSAARRSRKGTGFEGKSGEGGKTQVTQKSIEALAVEAAMTHNPSNLVKAVLEVPVHGKTRKRNIPDARLLAIFKAYVRTEYRNASRYNEGTNAQGIYDRVLSSAEYNHHVEAALGLLEKLKTPFSVDFVKRCIQEIEDAQKEAGQVAPEPTAPSSIAASGG